MSKMRSDRKPPLARSPMRLRPRRALRPIGNAARTPPGSLTKTQLPNRRPWDVEDEEAELRSEYHTISCELRALSKMVQTEFGNTGSANFGTKNTNASADSLSSPLFVRGRFYEEYSALRNERLKRKKGETGDADGERKRATVYDLGVKVESAKRRRDTKKVVVPCTPATTGRRENPRYMLRSMSKENKKPPLPVSYDNSVALGGRKTVAPSAWKS